MKRPPAPATCSVLVIEDDPDAGANLRDILELDDFRVEIATSAAQALARTDWQRYPIILLDRLLPDATADEMLPQLRRLAPDTSVVIVTGHSDIEGAITALRLGAADYLLKPLNVDALRLRMSRLMEQRRLAEAKERSEAVFRDLVEAAECMILMIGADHTILYFSPFAERLTGYSAEEVRGRDYGRLLLDDSHREAVRDAIRGVLGGTPVHGMEHPIVCRDGSERWTVWNSRVLAHYEGGPAVLGVGQDITELKLAQRRALQAERLAAIGHMVAGLAHESRNALQRSQACMEMLALKVEDRPDALALIGRIQRAQDDLHTLYEDVRDYAGPIALERTDADLGEIWREAWSHLEPVRQGREAVLVEDVSEVDLRCKADRFRLCQVFRNIFDNALTACPEGAVVRVTAFPDRLDGLPALRIAVRDNGPGLTMEQRINIFDSFYTTKTKGTGLGMAIAKRIVEAHGGRIAVGEAGPGAEILVTLPRGIHS